MDREKILIEEVKIVQDIIKRMAGNSFNVKTWTITLIVATLLFKGNNNHVFIAFIPLIAFWFLDSYYLVHDWVVSYRLNNDDKLFNMNPIRFKDKVQSVLRIMFSISTLPFYGSILIMLLIYLTIIYFNYFELLLKCIKLSQEGN